MIPSSSSPTCSTYSSILLLQSNPSSSSQPPLSPFIVYQQQQQPLTSSYQSFDSMTPTTTSNIYPTINPNSGSIINESLYQQQPSVYNPHQYYGNSMPLTNNNNNTNNSNYPTRFSSVSTVNNNNNSGNRITVGNNGNLSMTTSSTIGNDSFVYNPNSFMQQSYSTNNTGSGYMSLLLSNNNSTSSSSLHDDPISGYYHPPPPSALLSNQQNNSNIMVQGVTNSNNTSNNNMNYSITNNNQLSVGNSTSAGMMVPPGSLMMMQQQPSTSTASSSLLQYTSSNTNPTLISNNNMNTGSSGNNNVTTTTSNIVGIGGNRHIIRPIPINRKNDALHQHMLNVPTSTIVEQNVSEKRQQSLYIKMSANLLKTYKHINNIYYEKRKQVKSSNKPIVSTNNPSSTMNNIQQPQQQQQVMVVPITNVNGNTTNTMNSVTVNPNVVVPSKNNGSTVNVGSHHQQHHVHKNHVSNNHRVQYNNNGIVKNSSNNNTRMVIMQPLNSSIPILSVPHQSAYITTAPVITNSSTQTNQNLVPSSNFVEFNNNNTKATYRGNNNNVTTTYSMPNIQQSVSSNTSVTTSNATNASSSNNGNNYNPYDFVYSSSSNSSSTINTTSSVSGYDDPQGNYIVQLKEIIDGTYLVEEVMGKGSFGVVVKCLDLQTNDYMAVKIIKNKPQFHSQAQIEIALLKDLNQKDMNGKYNIVRMRRHFLFKNHLCIAFELLSMNLYDLLKLTNFRGISLLRIYKFGKQLLHTLNFLLQAQVIHCDLKPENILLKSTKRSTIKVIDFGSSCYVNNKMYTYIQSRFYRSPEVILGLPYGCEIDMWSFGCILVELHTGNPLFDGKNEVEQMFKMIQILGMPSRKVIEASPKKDKFFKYNVYLERYEPLDSNVIPNSISLYDIIMNTKKPVSPQVHYLENYDNYSKLFNLITKVLVYDSNVRLKPLQALSHEFFHLNELIKQNTANYSSHQISSNVAYSTTPSYQVYNYMPFYTNSYSLPTATVNNYS
ncbi:hypothetical protein ABK040_014057 [Willaertia magna]